MEILLEIIKFIFYSLLIVIISKYILVKLLRKLAEALQLSPKAVGNISGIATSVPELLTVSFSAFSGLIATSAYNIISSNIINFVQYILSVYLNKNQSKLQNKALKVDFVLVIITILIPILILYFKIEFNISIVPLFLLLFLFFYYINSNVHKLYLKKEDKDISKIIEAEAAKVKGKTNKVVLYIFLLLITAIALYFVGDRLSIVLSNLCTKFNVPELILGLVLGFTTSIPELITFFESQRHYKSDDNVELGIVEATNNLLTSNVLNLFIIQSIGIIIFSVIWVK